MNAEFLAVVLFSQGLLRALAAQQEESSALRELLIQRWRERKVARKGCQVVTGTLGKG